MKAFSGIGSNASGLASKTLLTIIAATTVRPALFEFIVGNAQSPADQAWQLGIKRFTAVGTAGSSPTPAPLDSGDVAALATLGSAHSAEPTYSTQLFAIDLNQRATFRWMANPGCEPKAPATANNGLGFQLISATAAMVNDITASWYE